MSGPCSCGAEGSSYSTSGSEIHSIVACANARPPDFATQPCTSPTGPTSASSNWRPASQVSLTLMSMSPGSMAKPRTASAALPYNHQRRPVPCTRRTNSSSDVRSADGAHPARARGAANRGPSGRCSRAGIAPGWQKISATSRAGAVGQPHRGTGVAPQADGCADCASQARKGPAARRHTGRPPRVAMGR
jgi:hypothetical protein